MIFEEYLNMNNQEKYELFMDSRVKTNRTSNYWVNWNNVHNNIYEHELNLNILNYLIGKEDIEREFKILFSMRPEILKTIPILIATREKNIDILKWNQNKEMEFYNIDFDNPDINKIDLYISFMIECGLFKFIKENITNSLVDYVYGIQTGLDSNGRKNRSGFQNESILLETMGKIKKQNPSFQFKEQVTNNYIQENWSMNIPESTKKNGKGGRRYDGAIYNPELNLITIIETNFYGGGGSKLKAVSSEFSHMYNNYMKNTPNVNFVWISDGPGWDTAKNSLRASFNIIPTILNLTMVNNGFLDRITNMKI